MVCARKWHEHTVRDHREDGDNNKGYGGDNESDGSCWWSKHGALACGRAGVGVWVHTKCLGQT